MKRNCLSALLVTLSVPGLALADTIILKSGAKFQGVIQDPESDPVKIELSKGNRIGFYRKNIEEIKFDNKRFDVNEMQLDYDSHYKGKKKEEPIRPLTEKEQMRLQRLVKNLLSCVPPDMGNAVTPECYLIIDSIGGMGVSVAPHLEQMIREGQDDDVHYLLLALAAASTKHGEGRAKELALSAASEDSRKVSLEILAKSEPKKYTGVFQSALSDEQGAVRLAAVKGLRVANDSAALPSLIDALNDPVMGVQKASLKALKHISGQSFTTATEWKTWLIDSASSDEQPDDAEIENTELAEYADNQ